MTDDVLRPKEAAALLMVSETTLRAAADAGQVPSVLVGSQRRYSREALMRHMSAPHPREAGTPRGAPVVLPHSRVRREKRRKVASVEAKSGDG